ncbi:MAG: tetratricopeptide repeat protein [Magnetococcales bacterium]|nr:tetratricopeptide repeat protein [Magnetococcales bacterium]
MSRIPPRLTEMEKVPGDVFSPIHTEPMQTKHAVSDNRAIVKSIPIWGWMLVTLILMIAWNAFWNTLFFQSASAEAPPHEATIASVGNIHAVTEPPGAGILMDGNFVGVTPIRFDWEPGSHRLEIKKYGYHDLIVDLNLEQGRKMEVDLRLYPVMQQSLKTNDPPPGGMEKISTANTPGKPSAWVVKPGQGNTPPEHVETTQENNTPSARVYTVEEGNKQTITGRVQEMARNEMPFRYSIQVGAFLDRDSALRLAAFWRRKGYDAYLLELYGIKDPSRLWQSVRIGRFDNIMVARRFMDNFRAKEKTDGYLALSDSFAPPTQALLTAGIGHTSHKPASQRKESTQAIVPQSGPAPSQMAQPEAPTHLPNGDAVTKQVPPVSATAPIATPPEEKNKAEVPEEASIRWLNASAPSPGAEMAATNTEKPKDTAALSTQTVPVDGSRATQSMEPAQSRLDLTPPNMPVAVKNSTEEKHPPTTQQTPPSVGAEQPVVPATTANMTSNTEVQALYDQALAEERNGRSSNAQELYKRVLEHDSGHLLARQRLARIYVESGQAAEALTILKPAVSGRDPQGLARSDPNFSAFLAALYQRQEEHQKAVELYEALLRGDPGKGIWQMGIAISLEKLQQPENALRYYEKAMESGELSTRLRAFVQKRARTLKK